MPAADRVPLDQLSRILDKAVELAGERQRITGELLRRPFGAEAVRPPRWIFGRIIPTRPTIADVRVLEGRGTEGRRLLVRTGVATGEEGQEANDAQSAHRECMGTSPGVHSDLSNRLVARRGACNARVVAQQSEWVGGRRPGVASSTTDERKRP